MENEGRHKEEIKFVKKTLLSWRDIPDSEISFRRLTGISNVVYKVTADAEVSPKNIILRKFGHTEDVVDKKKESLIFEMMSETGRGPKCYGQSAKYRLEEYFDAKPIETTQINEPYWRRRLAVALAKFHVADVTEIKKESIILDRLKNVKFYEEFNSRCLKKLGITAEQFKKLSELKILGTREERQYVKSITPSNNLVFSHNDTLNGNILVAEKDKKIILIDYEYSGFNNRAYDAANLFIESMMSYENPEPPFFELDPQIFPTLDEVKDFARYYLYAACFCDEGIENLENKRQVGFPYRHF